MLVRVSQRAGMWGFGPLWFTFADPKPQEINPAELDGLTRDKVNLAIAQGTLIEVDEKGNKIVVLKKVEQAVQQPIVNCQEVLVKPQVSPVIARKLSELLKNGVTTLRREICFIKSPQMLDAALQLEKQNKNRKTVIGLLEKAIEKMGGNKKMGRNEIYDDLIEEEDIETVTFSVEDIILESQEKIIEVDGDIKDLIQKKIKKL